MTASAGAVRRRPSKGAAIVIVTAASLGVGGLAAAGPGFFPSIFDQPTDPELIDDRMMVELPDAVIDSPTNPPATDVVPGGDAAAVPGVSPARPDASEPSPTSVPTLDETRNSWERADNLKCAQPPVGPDANAAPDEPGPPSDLGQQVPDVAADCAADGKGQPDQPANPGSPEDPGSTTGGDDASDKDVSNAPDPATPTKSPPDNKSNASQGSGNPETGQPAQPGEEDAETKTTETKTDRDN